MKKDNHNKTKTIYQKNIFKTKKRSLRIRHKHNTGTSRLKEDSISKNNPINDQIYFSDSEATTSSSIKGKRKIKKSYINKPIRLYNWSQPIRQIESYTLTVLQYKT